MRKTRLVLGMMAAAAVLSGCHRGGSTNNTAANSVDDGITYDNSTLDMGNAAMPAPSDNSAAPAGNTAAGNSAGAGPRR